MQFSLLWDSWFSASDASHYISSEQTWEEKRPREGKAKAFSSPSLTIFVTMILPFLPNSHLHLKIVAKQRAEPQHLWSHQTFSLDALTKSWSIQIFGSWPKCPAAAQQLGKVLISSQPPWGPAQGAGEEKKMVLTSQSYCSHFSLRPTCTERPEKSRKLQQAMGKTHIPAGEVEEGQVVRALSLPQQSEQTETLLDCP